MESFTKHVRIRHVLCVNLSLKLKVKKFQIISIFRFFKSDDSRVNAVLFGMRLSVVAVAPDIY